MALRALSLLAAMRSKSVRDHMDMALKSLSYLQEAECPCCGYKGKFESFGTPVRIGANCPSCESKERHRLFSLAMRNGFIDIKGKSVLHFAPEPVVQKLLISSCAYKSADIEPGKADLLIDIQAIDLDDSTVDTVVCSHVLEHVDDERALSEIRRILKPGGHALIMIPIVEGWEETYENPSVKTHDDRHIHFGQYDHIRYYGADFRQRVKRQGFALEEYTANGEDSVRFGLMRGEKIFKAIRPS